MKISIVVLSWNSKKYISSCLDSIKKLDSDFSISTVEEVASNLANGNYRKVYTRPPGKSHTRYN